MQNPPQVITANIAFIIFWAVLVAFIWLVGQRFERTRAFRARMIAQWKPAFAITVIFLISNVLSGRSQYLRARDILPSVDRIGVGARNCKL